MITKEQMYWFNNIESKMRKSTFVEPLTVDEVIKRLQLLPKDSKVSIFINDKVNEDGCFYKIDEIKVEEDTINNTFSVFIKG